jgi:hypothetical protein
MKKKFVLIAALIAALAVVFTGCWDDLHGGVGSGGGGGGWDAAVGMTAGIAAQGSATFSGGILDFTHVGTGDYDDGALFTVAAPGATSASTITIKYICKGVSGTPKLTLKNGGWSTDLLTPNGGDCNWYPVLTKDVEATLVVKGSWYTAPTTGIWFQRNGDTNAFKIKIISVTVS